MITRSKGKIVKEPYLPPQITALIYDCDGVLIDSARSNEAYYNHILAHFGFPSLRQNQLEDARVLTAEEMIDLLFKGTPHLAQAQDFQKGLDNDRFIPLAHVEPTLRETLRRLPSKYRRAVASNRGKSLRPLLEYHRLLDSFDLLVSSIDVKRPKPDPEYLLRVTDTFKIEVSQALYIGDSETDLLTAQKAGVLFVAYKNQALETLWHIDNHLDLFRILDQKLNDELNQKETGDGP